MTAILVDAGPIVALFDASEANHARCREALATADGPLVTCEGVLAEACWLLRRFPGARRDLLLDVVDRRYVVDYRLADRADAVARLMSKYSSVPMSLADACLVDLAGEMQSGRILTLDADFHVYRWGRNQAFELLLNPQR